MGGGDPFGVLAEGTGRVRALSDGLRGLAEDAPSDPDVRMLVQAVANTAATTVEMVAQMIEARDAGEEVHIPPAEDILAELAAVTACAAATVLVNLDQLPYNEDIRFLVERAGGWAVDVANPPVA